MSGNYGPKNYVPNPQSAALEAVRPRDEESQPLHEVKVVKVSNGFIIVVGCKTFVTSTWAEASGALLEYYADPGAAFKKYCK